MIDCKTLGCGIELDGVDVGREGGGGGSEEENRLVRSFATKERLKMKLRERVGSCMKVQEKEWSGENSIGCNLDILVE